MTPDPKPNPVHVQLLLDLNALMARFGDAELVFPGDVVRKSKGREFFMTSSGQLRRVGAKRR